MKKFLISLLCACTILVSFCACENKTQTTPGTTTQAATNQTATNQGGTAQTGTAPSLTAPSPTATPNVDATTTASIVNKPEAFLKAISKDGTWIIAILNDMTINQDLVLDGQFKNSQGVPERKLAFYAQDDKRNVTARYTMTAPKLTVKSDAARIQGGTFVGDVYVEAKNFLVTDATVKGNVYFANDEAKNTFKLENNGKVTGVQEVKK